MFFKPWFFFLDSKENTGWHLCTKWCGKQLHREDFRSYCFEIIAELIIADFGAVRTAIARVMRERIYWCNKRNMKLAEFSVSKVSALLEKPLVMFTWHCFFRVWLICLIKVIFFIWIMFALYLDFWAAEEEVGMCQEQLLASPMMRSVSSLEVLNQD